MDKYRWEDGGKELLLAFEILIRHYGGVVKLAKNIETEAMVNNSDRQPMWTPYQESFLINNYYKYNLEELSLILKRTPGAITFKAHSLMRAGRFQTNYGFNK